MGARWIRQLRVVLLLPSEVCSLSEPGAWVWLSPCSQGAVWRRIFCREQHHFWGSILNPFMAVSSSARNSASFWSSSASAVLLSVLRALGGAVEEKAVGWLWQERFVPCVPVMVTSPSNQLTAFGHFLHLLSCGIWCVFIHVLPFGEGDGGRGRSLQCLKGSG